MRDRLLGPLLVSPFIQCVSQIRLLALPSKDVARATSFAIMVKAYTSGSSPGPIGWRVGAYNLNPRVGLSSGSLEPSGFQLSAVFVRPSGFYLYAAPSGLSGFHMFVVTGLYAAYSSPYSSLYLLKSSVERNTRVSDGSPYWCMMTFRSLASFMAWVEPLAIAELKSLCPMLGALRWPLFVL